MMSSYNYLPPRKPFNWLPVLVGVNIILVINTSYLLNALITLGKVHL